MLEYPNRREAGWLLWVVVSALLSSSEAVVPCPEVCTCELGLVDCAGQSLERVPQNIPPRAHTLDLSNNSISQLAAWPRLPQLTTLHLAGNLLSTIGPTVFRQLTQLRRLDLSRNRIANLVQIHADRLLTYSPNLTSLDLSHNPLTSLGGGASDALRSDSLTELNVSWCQLSHVDGRWALNGLPRLAVLRLAGNPLKWLDNLSSKSLTRLDVSACELDFLRATALERLPALAELDLSGNSGLSLAQGQLSSKSLIHLNAAGCSLTLPGIGKMPLLQVANLSGNKISLVPATSFQYTPQLTYLYLSHNEIREVSPLLFTVTKQLKVLDLSNNQITGALPKDMFTNCTNLEQLCLSNNNIVSAGFSRITQLRSLDISGCNIQIVHGDFVSQLPSIVSLNIARNPLEYFPDGQNSSTLESIDLSYCRLAAIRNATFQKFPALANLYLNGNRFTEPFKAAFFKSNKWLKHITLGDNPWICNCKSKLFKEFWDFARTKIPKADLRQLLCQSPEVAAGRGWENACHTDWNPSDDPKRPSIFAHSGVMVMAVILVVAVGLGVGLIVRRGVLSRKSRQDEAIRRLEEAERSLRRMREAVFTADDHSPPPQPRRQPSIISQPPPYEEAVLMPRLDGSRSDIASTDPVETTTEAAATSTPVSQPVPKSKKSDLAPETTSLSAEVSSSESEA